MERIYVDASVMPEFEEKVAKLAYTLETNDQTDIPLTPDTRYRVTAHHTLHSMHYPQHPSHARHTKISQPATHIPTYIILPTQVDLDCWQRFRSREQDWAHGVCYAT